MSEKRRRNSFCLHSLLILGNSLILIQGTMRCLNLGLRVAIQVWSLINQSMSIGGLGNRLNPLDTQGWKSGFLEFESLPPPINFQIIFFLSFFPSFQRGSTPANVDVYIFSFPLLQLKSSLIN